MNTPYIALVILCAALIAVGSCGNSTEPAPDTQAPDARLNLSVRERSPACPMRVSFYLDPTESQDNSTVTEDLVIRWDFDNNGEWDTDFVSLEGIWDHEPEPLPVGIWSVACEVKDQAGNVAVVVDSLVLPDFVPTVPDIGFGEITVNSGGDPYAHSDTIQAGENFIIRPWRSDWLHDYDAAIVQRLFLDGELIEEHNGSVGYPHLGTCAALAAWLYGSNEIGLHEVRVEVEFLDGTIDTDLSNNSATAVFYIVE